MTFQISSILDQVNALQIPEEQKNELVQSLTAIDKKIYQQNWMIKKAAMEKSIASQFLNTSIDELQKQQQEVAKVNAALSSQKQNVQLKNEELSYQKSLLEKQSKIVEVQLTKLESSYKEMEQFSYVASHDLKSPLRTIANFAQLLKRKYQGKFDEDADDYLSLIVSGANQMNTVITDLLEYSKVGNSSISKDEIDLGIVLELVQFNLIADLDLAGGKIELQGIPETVLGNKSNLIQLFQNLIGNALKFKSDVAPIVKVSAEEIRGQLCFKIQDNGVGMDNNAQDKAFKPFQRLNNQERPGSGIGLAICKKIVENHGGKIWFESEKGVGTTFFFTIGTEDKNVENSQKGMARSGN